MANEDEAKAYTGMGESESLEILAGKVETAVVKIGKEGALLAQGRERTRCPRTCQGPDTTGAGDLWASGFLTA